MVKEYQLDPVTHQLLHADFYQLAMDKAITVTVPIVIKGEPKGVKLQGGMLDFVTREIEVECLPADIPGAHRRRRHRADAAPGDPRARPAGRSEVEAGQRRARRCSCTSCMPKAEEVGGGGRRRRRRRRPTAEPEVIKKGKTDEKDEEKKK